MTEPLSPDEVVAILNEPSVDPPTRRSFDYPSWVFATLAMFIIGVFLAGISNHLGCMSASVRLNEYRYCKRIGFQAFQAKADSAYWAQYGMQP